MCFMNNRFKTTFLTTFLIFSFSIVYAQEIKEVPNNLKIDSFYKKYMNVNGIPVVSSNKVPDSAFIAVYKTLNSITNMLPEEVMESLISQGARVAIMARYEGTTDIPEHRFLVNDTTINWDLRARGLGGTICLPLSTCAEENVLGYQIDKYHSEDILIHEFAHTIHNVGISHICPDFNKELQKALYHAIENGLWDGTYAQTNIEEYFAEGVQTWFNVNAESQFPNGKHNCVNTREELKRYDPLLYSILLKYFSETDEIISKHHKPDKYSVVCK